MLLMISVLRSLGAAVRLCAAWYPIPHRIAHHQQHQKVLKLSQSSENLSKAAQSKSKGKGKSYFQTDMTVNCDKQIWLEVFVASDQSWLTVDSSGKIIKDLTVIEEHLRKPVTYIMCYDNGGKVKDLTQKYDSSWMVSTRKYRVDETWWAETIAPYRVRESKKNKQEDELIKSQQEQMPFPATIGKFKDHPLYALERHLLKFESIYPESAVPMGFTKTKEPIYSRSCIHTLHSRETWLKEARQIKLGEEGYKFVKPRPKMKDIKNGIKITEATLPIYGLWQTEPYQPPTAENGKVPRNAYGNVDFFKPEMLPLGCVHLPDQAIGRVARKLNIDCAQAMIGWDIHSGMTAPVFDGWIVCKEHEKILLAGLVEYEAEAEQRAQEKLEKRVYANWKKLIKGLLIRERLRRRYGKDSF